MTYGAASKVMSLHMSTTKPNGNKNTQWRMISDGDSLQNVSLLAAISTAELV
jgi:hypothetical protein